MACDAQTVETLTVGTDDLYKLSERQWLECLANLFAEIANPNLALPIEQSAVNLAYSLGYPKLTDVQLEQALLAVFTASAYDAQTIVNEIAAKGYDKLSHAEVTRGIVAAFCAALGGTAQTIETLAIGTDQLNQLCENDAALAILAIVCAANSSQCLPPALLHWRGKWTQLSDRGLREVIAALAQYAITPPAPPCPVPTGLTTALQSDNTVLVSWDALPAGVTYTELWTSPDNVTFTIADNVAAPATTLTLPPQGATTYLKIRFCTDAFVSLFPLTDAWMAQVVTNGGATPSMSTRAFLTVFETATASINAKLYNVNVVAPDSLIAAKTPFIRKFGSALWTTIAVGTPPAEDLTVNGILAASNSTNGNVYDLGFGPAAVPSFNSGNCGCFAYYTTIVASAFDGIGCYDGVSAIGVQNQDGGNELYIGWTVASILFVADSGLAGLYMTSRTATNVLKGYFGNSTTGFILRGTNANNNAVAPNATPNVGACGELNAGPVGKPNPSRFSCFGVCDGLTLAEGTILYNAVQALRVGFGGGYA